MAPSTISLGRDINVWWLRRVFLLPANYNTERTKPYAYNDGTDPLYFTFTNYRYTSEQIGDFCKKFEKLNQSVAYLAGFIRKLDDETILFARAIKGQPVWPVA